MSANMSRRAFLSGVGALSVPVLLGNAGCGGSGGSGGSVEQSVLSQWNDAALAAIRLSKMGPPVVARALAIMNTSAFDAWAAYDQTAVGTRLGGSLRRPIPERTLANKNKAVSFAAYRALKDLFPLLPTAFDPLMAKLGYDPTDTSTNTATPAGIGNTVANAVTSFRHTDGANQLGDLHAGAYSDYTGYQPVNPADTIVDPNRWQPLRVSDGHGGTVVQVYVCPHWGHVTPFSLTFDSQFRPTAPLPLAGSDAYLAQAQQILDYSANLTDSQKVQTEYFADGPNSEQPPGHWILFSQFVSSRDRHSLDDDVRMFFVVSNAVFDAGIACWDAKRAHDSVRPITAIRYAFKGKTVRAWGGPGLGTVSMLGEAFGTYQATTLITPSFPEYFSGHSTFSAAAAEVLKRFTGSDNFGYSVSFAAGSSNLEPGHVPVAPLTFTWNTFSEAADAAGMSRRFGGIHFVQGDLDGRQIGRLVGAQVWSKSQAYLSGIAP